MTQPTHDILLVENYTFANGEEKAYFLNIGKGWLKESCTLSCELRKNLSITGHFMIVPVKDKAEA